MKSPIICPRCDGQGHVFHVTVRATALDFWLCDECDATWRSLEAISKANFEDYETLAKSLGISQLWDELELHDDLDVFR
jgi:hypothetical protein